MTSHLSLEDLKGKLAKSVVDEHTDKTLAAVLRAEAAAQASYTSYDGDRPADLDKALVARVEHNLAETGGAEPTVRIGIHAPGVRDLEDPYNRANRAARDDAAAASSATPRKRAAKRTARQRTAKRATSKAAASTTTNNDKGA